MRSSASRPPELALRKHQAAISRVADWPRRGQACLGHENGWCHSLAPEADCQWCTRKHAFGWPRGLPSLDLMRPPEIHGARIVVVSCKRGTARRVTGFAMCRCPPSRVRFAKSEKIRIRLPIDCSVLRHTSADGCCKRCTWFALRGWIQDETLRSKIVERKVLQCSKSCPRSPG